MNVFNIHSLPARYGDALWIEYGSTNETRHILVDGGTGGTRKTILEMIDKLPVEKRTIELLIVTHIDRDHIEGVLRLLAEPELPCRINEIWFNGWRHLPHVKGLESFGAVQGEKLEASIISHNLSWNSAFEHGPVFVPDEGDLPAIMLKGELRVTLLSPYSNHLENLLPAWQYEIEEIVAGLKEMETDEAFIFRNIESFGSLPDIDLLSDANFTEDTSVTNASSIAVLLSFAGKNVLLAGDALPSVLERSLQRVTGNIFPLDLLKISHHGGRDNTSPKLIEMAPSKRYLISTNSAIYLHPSDVTVARIIRSGKNSPELIFNYQTPVTKVWSDKRLQKKYNYRTAYPNKTGITIRL